MNTNNEDNNHLTDGLIGHFCVIRCRNAGVHAGVVEAIDGSSVRLKESRRLWSWVVPMGAPSFLSGVATHGVAEGSKLGTEIDILLTEACEVIRCSEKAEKAIREFEEVPRVR